MKFPREIIRVAGVVFYAGLIATAQPQAPAQKPTQPVAQAQAAGRPAQPPTQPSPAQPSLSAPSLDAIMGDIQQTTQATNLDLGRLRIDKWRTESGEKAQLQQVADSLRKNLTTAVPDLIAEVRSTHGSVSSTFKLYHNLNVVYEYLDSLVAAAGSLSKGDEYGMLNKDALALDNARKSLSTYIEQAASSLEDKLKAATAPPPAASPAVTPKRIVVDDSPTPANTKKKKTSSPRPASTPQ